MKKYENLTANIGIILKTIRLMDRYIHGFQIRKIFPFHLFLGTPDWEGYIRILENSDQDLKAQAHFIKQELKKKPLTPISTYLIELELTFQIIRNMIQALSQSCQLHRDRFFESHSVKLSELQRAIAHYQDCDKKFQSKAPKLRSLYQDMLESK